MGSFSNLDIAIGLIFVILVVSLACMAINEWIAQLMALRSGTLRNGINQLLEDDLARQFYDHPLIASLRHQGRFDRLTKRPGNPSYIAPPVFATTLLDIAAKTGGDGAPLTQDARGTIEQLPDGRAKAALLALLDQAEADAASARPVIEQWFDEAMNRVSGQYKRRIQMVTIGVAVVVTVLINADAIVIANALRGDQALRAAIVSLAEETVNDPSFFATPEATSAAGSQDAGGAGDSTLATTGTPPAGDPETAKHVDKERIQRLVNQTAGLGLPLGWGDPPDDAHGWGGKFLGLLIMAAAVSLGAPFWFDMLSKVVHIRTTGPPPATGQKQ